MYDPNMLKNLADMIDISAVRANSSISEIDQLIASAKNYRFICAFALPSFTPYLANNLKKEGLDTKLGGVVGFPSGAETTSTKICIAEELMRIGCDELDMVINIGAMKSGNHKRVYEDIHSVVETAGNICVKTILEVCYLTDDEIKRASEIAVKAGAAFVKTGTGWGDKPTTIEHIRLIRSVIGDQAKIKAAGGIRDLQTVMQMIEAGCARFGVGVHTAAKIMEESSLFLQGREGGKA